MPPAKLSRLPAVYHAPAGKLEQLEPAGWIERSTPPRFPRGDAGLLSTVDDCFAFARLLLSKGRAGRLGQRLLSEASVAAMTQNHLTALQRGNVFGSRHGWGYGLAVNVATTPEGMPEAAYGWNGGRGTSLWMEPRSGRTLILMTQRQFESPDPPSLHKDFWRAGFGGDGLTV
jgi:CubicO group peptidase (beta-lactamase class C family)